MTRSSQLVRRSALRSMSGGTQKLSLLTMLLLSLHLYGFVTGVAADKSHPSSDDSDDSDSDSDSDGDDNDNDNNHGGSSNSTMSGNGNGGNGGNGGGNGQDDDTQHVCPSGFSWLENNRTQDPCEIASPLIGLCIGMNTTGAIGNLSGSTSSFISPGGSAGSRATPCTCSWTFYNLVQACTACQGHGLQSWPSWSSNCTIMNLASTETYWPANITFSNVTSFPAWSILNPTSWTNQTFDVVEARSIDNQGLPDVDSPTDGKQPPLTAPTKSTPSHSHVGTIVGAVLGVVGGLLFLLLAFLCVRHHWRRRTSNTPRREVDLMADNPTVPAKDVKEPFPAPSINSGEMSERSVGNSGPVSAVIPPPSPLDTHSPSLYSTTSSTVPLNSNTIMQKQALTHPSQFQTLNNNAPMPSPWSRFGGQNYNGTGTNYPYEPSTTGTTVSQSVSHSSTPSIIAARFPNTLAALGPQHQPHQQSEKSQAAGFSTFSSSFPFTTATTRVTNPNSSALNSETSSPMSMPMPMTMNDSSSANSPGSGGDATSNNNDFSEVPGARTATDRDRLVAPPDYNSAISASAPQSPTSVNHSTVAEGGHSSGKI